MREKKFGKRCLTWVLVLMMTLSLLPVSALAEDGEARFYGKNVTSTYARDNTSVSAAAVQNTDTEGAVLEAGGLVEVPVDKLFFDNGVIRGIDEEWLAANGDKTLSVTIPAEINGTPVTSIGQNAFKARNAGLKNHPQVAAVDFSKATHLEKIDNQAFQYSQVASVDLSETKVTTIGKFAFSQCTALREVILPSNLTELASSVFTDCKHVESIRLKSSPEGVVFELPEGLTTIGYQCFKNCFADGVDAKVIIPASAATLGEGAFYDKHITQIIINKKCDVWGGGSVYDSSAIRIPDGTNCMIIFPDKSTYESFKGYSSTERNAMTYPVEVKFFINYNWESEYHLNYRLLGYQKNATTGFWEFDDSYALPEAPASSAEQKPGYDYIGGWSGADGANIAFTLQNDEPLNVTPRRQDGSVSVKSGQGIYVLQNPTISYLVDGKNEVVDADQPFTVTIGDGKEHTLGVQVSHPLLLSEQGNEEDEYVYFEYCWWDEGHFADNGIAMTVNGPRSTEEPKLFSNAETDRELHRVWIKDNTIPITKVDHARTDHNYYLVEICGYIVKNNDPVRFYQSSNNFSHFGSGEDVATVRNYYTLQVKVDEVRVITATADEHGKIDPAAGTVTVPKGESKTFTITPDSGYRIKDVLVDGVSVGAVSTYTFEDVVENHTIHATFARKHTPTPSTPTVEIPDDDALGLNTTDHFAYIVGYGNGEVRPQNNITRAEVATIFFRLLTDDVRDENLTKTNRYSDVAATSWYNTAVSTLSSMGIITGYPDGTFRPNAAITRAEFAAIAARFDNDGDKTAAKFSDIANHWAKDEISIAYNNGWINGYPDGTFGPQRDITRAETMTLVNRVLNRQPETEDDLLPNMTVWTDNANPKAWYYLAVQEATNSHYYEFKTNSQYEKWTELRETRDWSQLEK